MGPSRDLSVKKSGRTDPRSAAISAKITNTPPVIWFTEAFTLGRPVFARRFQSHENEFIIKTMIFQQKPLDPRDLDH